MEGNQRWAYTDSSMQGLSWIWVYDFHPWSPRAACGVILRICQAASERAYQLCTQIQKKLLSQCSLPQVWCKLCPTRECMMFRQPSARSKWLLAMAHPSRCWMRWSGKGWSGTFCFNVWMPLVSDETRTDPQWSRQGLLAVGRLGQLHFWSSLISRFFMFCIGCFFLYPSHFSSSCLYSSQILR